MWAENLSAWLLVVIVLGALIARDAPTCPKCAGTVNEAKERRRCTRCAWFE
jgi:ribosomal protein S27AE